MSRASIVRHQYFDHQFGRKYHGCPNSRDMQHKWDERVGKNAGKPNICKLCVNLEADIAKRTDLINEDASETQSRDD